MQKNVNNKIKKNEKEKNNKKWLLLLLLLLFLCIFGYLIYRIGYGFGVSKRPVSPEPIPTSDEYSIVISDEAGKWSDSEEGNTLNIFVVSGRNYVAPYDNGVYKFDIVNEKNGKISYDLSITETNEDKVNIKYKLKNNGNYIIGQNGWVKYDQIVLDDIKINGAETHEYELEWMWVSEDNAADTQIGLKPNRSKYSMTINMSAIELEG